ncbi:MAG: hypothetical protein WAV13_09480 [Thermodesulfovibrionales bacterium]
MERTVSGEVAKIMSEKHRLRWIFPLLLVIIILLTYRSVLQSFWLGDDPQILKHAVSHHPWQYFFSPKVWQELSANNLTPWVTLSFDLDWNIFGLYPYGFYLHHLVSLCLLAVAAYAVLGLWFSYQLSFFAVLLFVISPPFAEASQILMVRHYIEGMLFALLSVYAFVKSIRNNNKWFIIPAVFFYLLACTAKEIYVPLIFLLLLLPEGDWSERWSRILPLLACTGFYILWRRFMLGSLWGGYGLPFEWPQDAKLFPLRVVDALGSGISGRLWFRWLIGGSSMAVLTILLINNKKAFFSTVIISLLVLLPVVPVSSIMSSRYIWLFSFWLFVMHIIAWHDLRKNTKSVFVRFVIILWGAILLSCFLFKSLTGFEEVKNFANQQGKEGIFFFEKGTSSDLLLNPSSPGWYFDGLSWLRKQVLHLQAGPSVIADTKILCIDKKLYQKYKHVWFFDSQKKNMISEDIGDFHDDFCSKDILTTVRENSPLSIVMEYRDAVISWKFGPYKDGRYELLFGEAAESVYPLPLYGSRPVYVKDSLVPFRLRYSSPQGWVTYSPLLQLEISSDMGHVMWER